MSLNGLSHPRMALCSSSEARSLSVILAFAEFQQRASIPLLLRSSKVHPRRKYTGRGRISFCEASDQPWVLECLHLPKITSQGHLRTSNSASQQSLTASAGLALAGLGQINGKITMAVIAVASQGD